MFKQSLTVASALFLAAGLAACDVEQTKEGNVDLPKYEVEQTQEARVDLPRYDVDAPDVDVNKKEKIVEVPTVGTEEKRVEVPDVDINMPKDE